MSARFVFERTFFQAIEILELSLLGQELGHLGLLLAVATPRRVFNFWEPPLPIFLKIKFDGNMIGGYGDAGFAIKGLNFKFITASGSCFFETTILVA